MVARATCPPPTRQARPDGLDGQGDGADEHRAVEPYISRDISEGCVCRTRVEVLPVLSSVFSISILSSIVAISVASKSRPSQLPLPPLPPPPSLRAANTRQPDITGHKQTVKARSSRIKRRAARGGGGRGARGTVQDAAAGWEGMESTWKMGRL
jgi:hypothetical protein